MNSENLLVQILSKGFPTRSHELWKYTDLSGLAQHDFKLALKSEHAEYSEFFKYSDNLLSDYFLIFLNGYLINSALPAQSRLKKRDPSRSDNIQSNMIKNTDIFENLNCFYAPESYELMFSKQENFSAAQTKLHILYLAQTPDCQWIQPRINIILGSYARVQLIESFISDSANIINAVMNIHVKSHAQLEYFKLQQEHAQTFHIGRTHIDIEKDALVQAFTLSQGAQLARSDIHVKLKASGAKCDLYGLSTSQKNMCLDHHTVIEHLASDTQSRQLYCGIIKDMARTVFNGKIIVHPHAHKTEADQANHHLLLSNTAEIDTKPELEIYHDDVKCTHGATIGQLDENALFYLQSRGLDKDTAQNILINAFSHQILDKIQDKTLREKLCLNLT